MSAIATPKDDCADLDGVHEELDALALLQAAKEGNAPHGLLHALLGRLVQVSNHVGHRQPAVKTKWSRIAVPTFKEQLLKGKFQMCLQDQIMRCSQL